MGKRLLILFSFSFLIGKAQPGKEAWHWYFGNKCGLNFSSGPPVTNTGIPGGYVTSGCASISDENTGQYLFSVGNTHIYNKNNVVMYNGYGMYSPSDNTQDLIVAKPGSTNIYYVFTPDNAKLSGHGVSYSIVDMNQQGGLGAVTVKNKQLLPPPATEKLTAVRHCNGVDYWVLADPGNSNAFNVYLITSAGLDTTPVVSHTGVPHQFKHWSGYAYLEGWGCLKASPNGKKLASAIQSDSIPLMEIFDFDNSTGIVSNPIEVNYPGIIGPFGVSFSPDNSKLYSIPYNTVYGGPWDTTLVYQYDMTSGNPATIISSQTLIYSETSYAGLSELQLAPDGKIYIAKYGKDTLAVINTPNASGTACNFQYPAIALPLAGVYLWGLPNFVDANYAGIQINLPDIKQCSTKPDTVNAGAGFTNYFWSTGASTQTITINSPGKYWVTVTNDQGCTRTDTMEAIFIEQGKKIISACVTDTVNTIQSAALTYNWSDGSLSPVKTFSASGTFWEDISFIGGCAVRDSFVITVNPLPVVNLGRDTTFCKGSLSLNAFNPNSTYQWNTGETTPAITVKTAGTYYVKVNMNNCFAYDTLIVNKELGLFDFVMPNIVTPNDDKINDAIDFSKYQFSTLQIQIFNRWGQEIFKSDDVNAIWKPTSDDGTYFYSGQYKIDCGTDSQTKNIKGFITVVR
jgi:gliding motility-associated-like protein